MMHKNEPFKYKELAEEIRTARLLCGLSQTRLSKLVGVSQSTIFRIEVNPYFVLFENVIKTIRILKIELKKKQANKNHHPVIKTFIKNWTLALNALLLNYK